MTHLLSARGQTPKELMSICLLSFAMLTSLKAKHHISQVCQMAVADYLNRIIVQCMELVCVQ